MAENTRDKETDHCWERFCTLSHEVVLQSFDATSQTSSESTETDKVYNHSVTCLQMFTIWGPVYREYMEKTLDDLMKEIDSSSDSQSLISLKIDKSKEDKALIGHLTTLLNFIDSLDISLDSMKPAEEAEAAKMVESINCKNYPMISYYSSQSGMKYWFRKVMTGLHSPQDRRTIQFGDENLYHRIQQQTMSSLTNQSTSETDIRMKVVGCYRMAASALCKFVSSEVQNLDLRNKDFRLPDGVVFRGEKMTAKEFEAFKEKVGSHLLKAYFQPRRFTEGLCSTTTDKNITSMFLGPNDTKLRNVLHIIHLVSPAEEELEEFYRLFPERYLMCATIKIDSLSDFPNEKEVMAPSLYVLTMNSYQSESSLNFHVECVLSPFYLYNGHSQQDKMTHMMEYKMAMTNLSRDPNSLLNHYRKYPHQLAVNYLEFLNGMVANRFMFQYYTAEKTRNEMKAQCCSTLIGKCLENMERLKSYHSIVHPSSM